MVTLQELYAARRRLDLRQRSDRRAAKVRCSSSAYWEIIRIIQMAGSPMDRMVESALGLEVVLDKFMLPGVWQLTDEHGTLLYDCRMRK